jgi:probable phosphoglycerate mutase
MVARRRIYLMRHGQVSYFEPDGRPVRVDDVVLTAEGKRQAGAAADTLAGIRFDRVVTSGLPRTLQTARIVAPGVEPESHPALREVEGGRLAEIPEDELEETFVSAFRDVVPEEARFLRGETIGALFDRVLPALDAVIADPEWDVLLAILHGAVNRAILSHALTGGHVFLGNLEQAPGCINVIDIGDDRIVRAVNVVPYDLSYTGTRLRTMEELYEQYAPFRRAAGDQTSTRPAGLN